MIRATVEKNDTDLATIITDEENLRAAQDYNLFA